MNTKLTTGEKLKDLRVERHLKLEELSKDVLIAASTLSNYENDENYDISAANIAALADYYDVSADYLLGRTERRTGTRTDIDELHLDDESINILKSGTINNRLVCELLKDPDIMKLLADIEIYVDGIAQTQINTVNSYVDIFRKEIVEKYQPDKDDKYLALLEAAVIDEGNYFANRIHKDMDEIISRIRESHKNDKTTMNESNVAGEILANLKTASNYKGPNDKKMVVLFCEQLGINHKTLTQEQFITLIEVLKKSKKLKNGMSNRGKRR